MDSEEDMPGTPLMDENDSDMDQAFHFTDEFGQQINKFDAKRAASDRSDVSDDGPASPDADEDGEVNRASDAESYKSFTVQSPDARGNNSESEDESDDEKKMEIVADASESEDASDEEPENAKVPQSDDESGNRGNEDSSSNEAEQAGKSGDDAENIQNDSESGKGEPSDVSAEYHSGSESDKSKHSDAESAKSEHSEAEVERSEHIDAESEKSERSDAESEKSGHSDAESEKSGHSDAESEKSGHSDAESEKSGHSDAESEKSGHSDAESEKSGHSDAESEKSGHSDAESEKSGHSDAESENSDHSDADLRKSAHSEAESEKGEDDAESEKSEHGDKKSLKDKRKDSESENQSDKGSNKRKRKAVIASSDEEEDHDGRPIPSSPIGSPLAADKEDESDKDSNVGELIADIFGESDNEEDFEGFDNDDVPNSKSKRRTKVKKSHVVSDSEGEEEAEKSNAEEEQKSEDEVTEEPHPKVVEKAEESSDDDDVRDRNRGEFVSDFELMMQRKKEERGSRRRRGGHDDIINDNDDLIAELISKMKMAADEDCDLNRKRMAATKKLKLLPLVLSQVRKQDLVVAFLDQGILGAFTDWLSPLPDKSLPHQQIRESLLKLLSEFPPIDQQLLKSSGIGRATMYLFKHPRESKINRERAGRLINEWSRPIFNVTANFRAISKEEREQRDFDHMPKKRKMSMEDTDKPHKRQDIDKALTGDEKALKPGEKGWIGRARVPLPSKRDYVVRPEWNVDGDITSSKGAGKKQVTRLEKHVRSFAERKRRGKTERAVKINIAGNKMAL